MPTKKIKRKIRTGRIVLILFCLVVLLFGGVAFYVNQALKPVHQGLNGVFSVVDGDTTKTVARRLEEEGYIKDATLAMMMAKMQDMTDIKKGNFQLSDDLTPHQIFEILNDPNAAMSNDVRITFIEGQWAKHFAKSLGENTGVSAEELLTLWNDETYVRSLMNDYPFLTEEIFNGESRILLEGYLFPDTYDFFVDTTADAITRKLLDRTLKSYNTIKDEIASTGLSVHEFYTLASIVQYEAGHEEDMKNVAGVFFNRLETGMKLQSSVTVCYAIDKGEDDSWTACEVNPNYDSPYNTYVVEGLPPGPILNPSQSALEAVLHPTEHDYYYFMADVLGDGTVYYSQTYEQHQAYVNKYLR